MEKYKLSKNIEITGFENYNAEKIPKHYTNGYYILNNKINEREYIINETIKFFIEKFSAPVTQVEVVESIQKELQSNKAEIEELCSAFFNFLCSKKIVIPEGADETVLTGDVFYKVGTMIGDLKITKILSESQYTDLYLTIDEVSGIQYVIKLLNKSKTINQTVFDSELTDLQKEFLMLQKAQELECVCRGYSLKKDEHENVYIVQEYFDSKSLSDFLHKEKKLTIDESLMLVEGIINAFADIHKINLVHGDIHSSNILVNENRHIKIIDLGLSFANDIENNEVLIFGGVNYYLPPERINISSIKKHAKSPDLYSDVYQIGLLLYLIMYNTLPFDGFIWEDLAKNIKEQKVDFSKKTYYNSIIPGEVIAIIKKCIEKDPTKRYASAIELLFDYNKFSLSKKEVFIN